MKKFNVYVFTVLAVVMLSSCGTSNVNLNNVKDNIKLPDYTVAFLDSTGSLITKTKTGETSQKLIDNPMKLNISDLKNTANKKYTYFYTHDYKKVSGEIFAVSKNAKRIKKVSFPNLTGNVVSVEDSQIAFLQDNKIFLYDFDKDIGNNFISLPALKSGGSSYGILGYYHKQFLINQITTEVGAGITEHNQLFLISKNNLVKLGDIESNSDIDKVLFDSVNDRLYVANARKLNFNNDNKMLYVSDLNEHSLRGIPFNTADNTSININYLNTDLKGNNYLVWTEINIENVSRKQKKLF